MTFRGHVLAKRHGASSLVHTAHQTACISCFSGLVHQYHKTRGLSEHHPQPSTVPRSMRLADLPSQLPSKPRYTYSVTPRVSIHLMLSDNCPSTFKTAIDSTLCPSADPLDLSSLDLVFRQQDSSFHPRDHRPAHLLRLSLPASHFLLRETFAQCLAHLLGLCPRYQVD
jgi:hypothetical protein